MRFPQGAETGGCRGSGDAEEGQTRSVGRPHRIPVPVNPRVHPREGAGGEVEHAHEGVGPPVAREGQLRAVRGPSERPRTAPDPGQDPGLRGGRGRPPGSRIPRCRTFRCPHGREGGEPDLPAAGEGETGPIGRRRDVGCLKKPGGLPPGEGNPPERLLHPLRIRKRIGVLPLAVGAASPRKEEGAAVRGPGGDGELLPVVGAPRRHRSTHPGGRLRNPHIPDPAVVLDPGHRLTRRSGPETVGKGRREKGLDRRGGRGGLGQEGRGARRRQRDGNNGANTDHREEGAGEPGARVDTRGLAGAGIEEARHGQSGHRRRRKAGGRNPGARTLGPEHWGRNTGAGTLGPEHWGRHCPVGRPASLRMMRGAKPARQNPRGSPVVLGSRHG